MKWTPWKSLKIQSSRWILIRDNECQKEDESDCEQRHRRDESNGYPLTAILCAAMFVCVGVWTLSCWYISSRGRQSLHEELDHDVIANYLRDESGNRLQCQIQEESFRFDCHPDAGASQESCIKRGCCWKPTRNNQISANIWNRSSSLSPPYCYYPASYSLYRRQKSTETKETQIHLFRNVQASGLPRDIQNVRLEVSCFDEGVIRVQIKDDDHDRFEVPYTNFDRKNDKIPMDSCDLKFNLSMDDSLNFRIYRRKSGDVM